MTRWRSISARNRPTSGCGHDHDLAAAGQDREAQHAGRVGQRRQGEVHRAAVERVAHQRDRRHRLEVAVGEHHALGPPGGAAGADQGDDVVRRRRPRRTGRRGPRRRARRRSRRSARSSPARRARRAWSASAASARSRRPGRRRPAGRSARRSRTGPAVRAFSPAALRGLIGHQTAPAREMPNTQVNAVGSLADRMPTLSPGRTPERRSAAGDRVGRARRPRRRTGDARRGSGRARRAPERGAFVQVVVRAMCSQA